MVTLNLERRRAVWLEEIIYQDRDLRVMLQPIDELFELETKTIEEKVLLYSTVNKAIKIIESLIDRNVRVQERIGEEDQEFHEKMNDWLKSLSEIKENYSLRLTELNQFDLGEIASMYRELTLCKSKMKKLKELMQEILE